MTLIDALLEAMGQHADRIAVEDAGSKFRYADLERDSATVARALRAVGVGPERAVVLDMPLGAAWLVAWLGVWRAGGAVVPLEPEDPAERRDRIAAAVAPVVRLRAPDVWAMRAADSPGPPPAMPRDADLAYIVFSSGSTGRPKGVLVEHRGLLGVVRDQVERFGVRAGDRSLALLSPAFDASISDFAVALLAGATWVVPPAGLRGELGSLIEVLTLQAITWIDLPPALLPALAGAVLPPALQTVIVGGEVADPRAVRALAQTRRVINVYGPTEASICATTASCDPAWEAPDLGTAIGGARLRIVEGELWIGGPGLARGYLHEPSSTAARFVVDDAGRWFRTGDRVHRDPAGRWIFEGRVDRQFKRRGRLIDPHEIEAIARSTEGVEDAAIVDVGLPDGGRAPVAVVVLASPHADREALIERWRALLPSWMVPVRTIVCPHLPRTPRGKIDVAALRALATARTTDMPSVDEDPIVAAWSAVLGVAAPQLDDDFFAAGGDSVAALALAARAQAAGVALEPADVYRVHTLGGLLDVSPWRARSAVAVADLEQRAHAWVAAVPHEPWVSDDGLDDIIMPDDAILLTGATGALGSRWLADAREHPRRPVIAVVRAPDLGAARQRWAAAMRTWGGAPFETVTVVTGDLTRPRCGWSRRTWDRIAAAVSTIVHAGAVVHLAAPLGVLEPANVAGTARMVALAQQARARLVPISTLSVLLETDAPQAADVERDDRGCATRVYGGYAASKWAAEAVVEHLDPPLRGPMLRLGLLTGEASSGRMVDTDQLSRTIRGIAKIGGMPPLDPTWAFDLTPIDDAVAELARWVEPAPGTPAVVHIAHRGRGTAIALRDAIARRVPLQPLTVAQFVERAGAMRDVDVAVARLALTRGGPGDLFLMTGRNPHSRRDAAAIDRPWFHTGDLLQRYVAWTLAKETR